MRVLFVNAIEGATVTTVNGSLNYPGAAIYHPFLRKKFKSLLDNDALTIDLVSEVAMTSFFMSFHNVTGGTVSFFDGTLTPVGTPLDMTNADAFYVAYFDSIQVKRIVVDVTTDAAQLFIGGIGAGMYYQMPTDPGLSYGYPLDIDDSTEVVSSPGGQTSRNKAIPLRSREFRWENLSFEVASALDTKVKTLGIGKPIYVDIFELERTLEGPMYAFISEPRRLTRTGQEKYTITINFQEAQ